VALGPPSCANACPDERPATQPPSPAWPITAAELQALRGTGIEYIPHRRHPPVRETGGSLPRLPAKLPQLEELGIHGRILGGRAVASSPPSRRCARASPASAWLDDETGNAHLFCRGLASWPRPQRALLPEQHSSVVRRPSAGSAGVRCRTDANRAGVMRADAVVLAAGSYPELVRPLGMNLPIYPVKGYSITAPVIDPDRAPSLSLTDESRRVVSGCSGTPAVAGTAELNGFDLSPRPRRSAAIVNWLEDRRRRRSQPG
jgi:D-amino-acid dehydrogenase